MLPLNPASHTPTIPPNNNDVPEREHKEAASQQEAASLPPVSTRVNQVKLNKFFGGKDVEKLPTAQHEVKPLVFEVVSKASVEEFPTSVPLNPPQQGLFSAIKRVAARALFYLAGPFIRNGINKQLTKDNAGGILKTGGSELAILPALGLYKKELQNPNKVVDPSLKMVENRLYLDGEDRRKKFFQTHSDTATRINLKTVDQKATLDGVILWSKKEDKANFEKEKTLPKSKEQTNAPGIVEEAFGKAPPPPGKWIVRYLANAARYEDQIRHEKNDESMSKEMEAYKKAGFNVLVFNYRGVMDSTGYPNDAQNDLLADGQTPVSFLQKLGVKANDITLVGESLGGGIATEVAAKNKGVRLANMRSFGSLSSAVGGMVYNIFGRNVVALGIAYMARSIASGILAQTNWEIHSLRAWNTIDLKDKWMLTAGNDKTITNMGKLFKATLQEFPKFKNLEKNTGERRSQKALVQRHLHAIKASGLDHDKPLTDNEDAFQEHLRYLQHTPEEVSITVKSGIDLSEKIELLKWLPSSSVLYEADEEFRKKAEEVAAKAMENENTIKDGYYIRAKLALYQAHSDVRNLQNLRTDPITPKSIKACRLALKNLREHDKVLFDQMMNVEKKGLGKQGEEIFTLVNVSPEMSRQK